MYFSFLQFTLNMNEYLMLDSGGCLCLDCIRTSTALPGDGKINYFG